MMKMIETYYRMLKHNPEGRLVGDSGLIPSHSYVIQFLELVEAMFKLPYGSSKSVTNVDNVESIIVSAVSAADMDDYGRMDAGVGADTHGIVVGTNAGSSPVSNTDHKLDTKILHSAAGEAGKLNYQAVTLVAPTESAGNIDFDISRAFLNETGSTITVREIGLICKNIANSKYHLLLRDVVSDEDVLDRFTLTVVYTLRTTA